VFTGERIEVLTVNRMVNHFISLLAICLFFGCNGVGCGNSRPKPKPDESGKAEDVSILTVNAVNVYIENSGSMDGYLSGNTDFKGAVSRLPIMLDNYYEGKVSVQFINSKIDSTTLAKIDLKNLGKDITTLWEKSKTIRRQNAADTGLNNIFKEVLSRTDDHTISIIFSDCIPSIGKGGVEEMLKFEKNSILATFNSTLKRDNFTTTILKMKSNFNGWYFPYTGDQNRFQINMERPYYICIIANRDLMNDFNGKPGLKFESLDGYTGKYVLSNEDTTGIYHTVLLTTGQEGRFGADRKYSNTNYVHDITGAEPPRNGYLSFYVAVDFSKLPVDDDYLRDPDNYKVTTNNFIINEIKPIAEISIKPSDTVKIKGQKITHAVKLTAKTKAVNDVTFVLIKQMPEWIETYNIEDDTSKEKLNNKTFGLKYWMEGIAESYKIQYPGNENYFECKITIGK